MLTRPSKSQNRKYPLLDLGLTYTHSSCHDPRANNSNCILLLCNSTVITTDNSTNTMMNSNSESNDMRHADEK